MTSWRADLPRETYTLSDFHTPEFRALYRYERLAQLAEQHGSRLIAQEARNRAAALRDYITEKSE